MAAETQQSAEPVATAAALRARIIAPVTAERERIKEGEQETHQAIDKANAAHAKAMARWQEQANAAHAAFRATPPQPTPPDLTMHSALLHRVIDARGQCQDRETRLIGQHRPDVEAAYKFTEPDLIERTRQTQLGDVDQILSEWNAWLSLLRETRGAAERLGNERPHFSATERMRQRITAADLLDAIDGVDLMAIVGIPWKDRPTRDAVSSRDPDGFPALSREAIAAQRRTETHGRTLGGQQF